MHGYIFDDLSRHLSAVTSGYTRDRCARICRAVEDNFYVYFGKMEDGTPCPPTEKGYKDARCAGGNCVVSFNSI